MRRSHAGEVVMMMPAMAAAQAALADPRCAPAAQLSRAKTPGAPYNALPPRSIIRRSSLQGATEEEGPQVLSTGRAIGIQTWNTTETLCASARGSPTATCDRTAH